MREPQPDECLAFGRGLMNSRGRRTSWDDAEGAPAGPIGSPACPLAPLNRRRASADAFTCHAAPPPHQRCGYASCSNIGQVAAPGWHECYAVSTVLVAHITNLRRATQKLGPEEELLAYHRVTAALDHVLSPDRNTIWKVSRFELPYYCAMCPAVNTHEHADSLVKVALRLMSAAREMELPNGERATLQLGICTGAASAGIIGSEAMSFIVAGPAARIARHLADCGAAISICRSTWNLLGDMAKGIPGWISRPAIPLPGGGCVDAQVLLPAPACDAGAGAAMGGADAAAAGAGEDACWRRGGGEAAGALRRPQQGAGGGGAGCGVWGGRVRGCCDERGAEAAVVGTGCGGICGASCWGQWTAGSGFMQEQREAAFLKWHNQVLGPHDQFMLAISLLSAAVILYRRHSSALSTCLTAGGAFASCCGGGLLQQVLLEGCALLGPGLVLLVLLRAVAGSNAWLTWREQICCAAKLSALLLGCTLGSTLGAAPAAIAAAAARGVLPLPLLSAPGAPPAPLPWLISTAAFALACKVRLQAQLLLSAASIALIAGAVTLDSVSGGASSSDYRLWASSAGGGGVACCALCCAFAAAAVHCGVVYAWDCHLRRAFVAGQRGPQAAVNGKLTSKKVMFKDD